MKIRSGFVSNSSSSSFIIRGIELTDTIIDLLFIDNNEEKEQFLELYNDEEKDFYYIVRNLENFFKKKNLKLDCQQTFSYDYDNDNKILIGKEIRNSLSDGVVIEIDDFDDVDMDLNKNFNTISPDILNKSKIKLYIQYTENH